jgi:predicted porin
MKKFLPLFMLAVSVAAIPSAASAQSSVRISGILGVGPTWVGGAESGASNYVAGRQAKLTQDSKVPTRLVFRGSEDLGDGMAAVFLLDKGFNVDDGSETLGGAYRESYVGLRTHYGTLTLGRQFHPLFNVRDNYDPTADSSNLMATAGFRMNNSIMYLTPTWSGLYAKLAYGFGESANGESANRAVGAHVGYDIGKFSTMLGYNKLNDANGANSARNLLWSGSYNFGPVAGYIEYGVNKGFVSGGVYSPVDSTDLLLGVNVPIGIHALAFTYVRKDDRLAANADAYQLQLLLTYRLSKRTALYGVATKINNRNGAVYTTAHASPAPTAAQYALGARPYDSEFSVGIRHSF